eukprot:3863054-Rhodomonas_salina.1
MGGGSRRLWWLTGARSRGRRTQLCMSSLRLHESCGRTRARSAASSAGTSLSSADYTRSRKA